jgi:hypothetical protein
MESSQIIGVVAFAAISATVIILAFRAWLRTDASNKWPRRPTIREWSVALSMLIIWMLITWMPGLVPIVLSEVIDAVRFVLALAGGILLLAGIWYMLVRITKHAWRD